MSSAAVEPSQPASPALRDWLENIPEPSRMTIARLYLRALELGREDETEQTATDSLQAGPLRFADKGDQSNVQTNPLTK